MGWLGVRGAAGIFVGEEGGMFGLVGVEAVGSVLLTVVSVSLAGSGS